MGESLDIRGHWIIIMINSDGNRAVDIYNMLHIALQELSEWSPRVE